jgi:two-component system sensor histidine kinase DegS
MYDVDVEIENCSCVSDSGRPEVETAMYYIVHEAVFNAAKHSECGHIRISFAEGDRFISACVRDDGSGMRDSNTQDSGLGLRLMAQRAKALGGSIQISNARGCGTEVICKLPFRSHSN